jgi:hypothetical protein
MHKKAAVVVAALALAAFAAPEAQAHRWGCWIQADRNVKVRNVASRSADAAAAINEWNADTILNISSVSSGEETLVLDGNYGNTGWGGLASLTSVSGCTILKSTAKLNLYYSWTSNAARGVFCQEVGHTFGLDHSNDGGCMGGGYWYDIGTFPAYTVITHNINDIGSMYATRSATFSGGDDHEHGEEQESLHASWISNPRSLAETEKLSEAIVVATVRAIGEGDTIEVPYPGGVDRIPTQRIGFEVRRTIKGEVTESFVLFQNGDDDMRFNEDPDYNIGGRYLLFLVAREDGTYRVVSPEGRYELTGTGVIPAADDGFAKLLFGAPLKGIVDDVQESMRHTQN